ncbi:MAG: hypothetical protein HXN30_00285 [Prevotella histicola]|nr:hypothetical protein [Prevotella histicola]
MKRYTFYVTLSNGNEFHVNSVGKDKEDAIERFMSLPKTIEFIGKATVTAARLVKEEEITLTAFNRFVLQSSKNKGWWVVGDPEGTFVVRFKEGEFNETREITYLRDSPMDALEEAHVLREIPEWLQAYYSEVL